MKFETRPEWIVPDLPLDYTIPAYQWLRRRDAWAAKLAKVAEGSDVWALVVTRSDGEVRLFDVSNTAEAANYGSSAQILVETTDSQGGDA